MAKNSEKTATETATPAKQYDGTTISFTPAVREAIDKKKAEAFKAVGVSLSDLQIVYSALEKFFGLPTGSAQPQKGRAAAK
jgi:hypothetical protein